MSELADQVRSERRRWAVPGGSHDRVISLTRKLTPAGIVLLVILLAFAPLMTGRDISFVLSKDRVQVAKERMRVSKAQYRGEDNKGQPFVISAGSAVQRSSADTVVRLENLAARIQLQDGPAAIAANRGRYDLGKDRIAIDGPVLFKTADGYRLLTRDVGIDLETRTLASAGAVDGSMPLGTFRADHLIADLNRRVVTLSGRARLHIVQGQSTGTR
ncbi:MAG: LPS export ABC transporter periplasmic protein LptC [Sphingomonadaceae bacterium]